MDEWHYTTESVVGEAERRFISALECGCRLFNDLADLIDYKFTGHKRIAKLSSILSRGQLRMIYEELYWYRLSVIKFQKYAKIYEYPATYAEFIRTCKEIFQNW